MKPVPRRWCGLVLVVAAVLRADEACSCSLQMSCAQHTGMLHQGWMPAYCGLHVAHLSGTAAPFWGHGLSDHWPSTWPKCLACPCDDVICWCDDVMGCRGDVCCIIFALVLKAVTDSSKMASHECRIANSNTNAKINTKTQQDCTIKWTWMTLEEHPDLWTSQINARSWTKH